MKSGLYLVGTPIGNLEDISARALATLREVGLILAEDTRHTRILLERYQIRAALVSCHQHNEASRAALVLERIRSGEAVALVTNAGMPGVSDPGARIVRACRQAGLAVTVIPGASSVTAAVALCGFIAGGFHCEGFLPRKEGARKRRMQQLLTEPLPVVLMESPYRCLKALAEWSELAPERELFLARELTKLHEECIWGTVHDVYHRLAERANAPGERAVRGEIVMVLAPGGPPHIKEPHGADGALRQAQGLERSRNGRALPDPFFVRELLAFAGDLAQYDAIAAKKKLLTILSLMV